jgi:predicted ABC-type ATPase
MPELYVICGPNGAGKTTVATRLLASSLRGIEYINADIIADQLSPGNPEISAIAAGRIMLARLHDLAASQQSLAFETTLASRTFAPFLRTCKARGYTTNLLYVWLRSPELAVERVSRRVSAGGHSIPEDVIRRRYDRGKSNLFSLYLPLCDRWVAYDNSATAPVLIAEGGLGKEAVIQNTEVWHELMEAANG